MTMSIDSQKNISPMLMWCFRIWNLNHSNISPMLMFISPMLMFIAMQEEKWRSAMGSEYGALEENQTWTIEDLPPGKKEIGCQWIFKVKFKSNGTVEKYKVRLVAMGNKQIEWEDYGETFSPVAKMERVRLFFDIAAKRGWIVHQMDVHNAFLHGLKKYTWSCLPALSMLIRVKSAGYENLCMDLSRHLGAGSPSFAPLCLSMDFSNP